jgi:alkylhydroperoxidase/carboxymuconolactone decarboxylase family protein YurZ
VAATHGIDDVRLTLQALAVNDNSVRDLLNVQESNIDESGLDPRTWCLVKLAALVAIDAPPASYVWHLTTAEQAGVTPADVLSVLVALAPTVGVARIVAAAPEIALGLGLDADDVDGAE